MLTRVQKRGDNIVLRIPPAIAADAHLENDAVVEVSLVAGQIVVKPMASTWTLEKLLAGVNQSNIHHEIDTGPHIGQEVW